MAARVTPPRLVGRTAELARLAGALADSAAGRPRLALVAGEAGIGKSRLLQEFLATARATGAATLLGTCVPMAEQHLPYAPIADALRGLLESEGDTLAPLAADLSGLLPTSPAWSAAAVAGQPEPAEQRSDQATLFRVFTTLVERLSRAGPVLLAVEDLHWADRSTIGLLGFLHRRLRTEPVLIVATYRDDELAEHPLRDWLAEAVRLDSTVLVAPPRFSRTEATAHLAGVIGAPPGADLVDVVFARSAGNPLYAEMLVEAGGDLTAALPDSISELILRRFRWLTDPAQDVVRVASVCGPRVRHGLLAALCEVPEAELTRALRLATEYRLLIADRETDHYTFAHVLIQEAVYADCLPAQRRAWHARIAALLTGHPELSDGTVATAAGEVAYHALRAGDDATALPAAVRAGLAALDVAANAEAYDHFARAAKLWDRVPDATVSTGLDHAGLLAHAAAAADLLGHDQRAVEWMTAALDAAGPDADPERLALMHERLGRYHFNSARFAPAWEAYQTGLALLPPEPPTAVRATVVTALAELAAGWARPDDARRYGLEAIALAKATGATRQEAGARHALGLAMVHTGQCADGIAELRAALDLYAADTDADALLMTHIDLTDCLIQSGDLAEAVTAALAGLEVARTLGREPQSGGFLLCNAAEAAVGLGRWSRAQGFLEDAAACGLRGAREFPLCVQSARLAIGRGDVATATHWLDRARGLLADAGAPPQWLRSLVTQDAELAAWQHRADDARAAVDAGLRAVRDTGEDAFTGALLAAGLRVEADAAERARVQRAPADDARVKDLLDRAHALAPLPDQRAYAAVCAAEAARALDEPADELWRAALRRAEELDRPYLAGYCGFRLAEAMLRRSAPGDPEAVLRAARERADALGATPLAAEIDALAGAYRLRLAEPVEPGAGAGTDAHGLTPREVEVLCLVAAGRSNGEIAEALFISTKTASVHVSNILRKLGAANRREAARAGRLLGLVGPAPVSRPAG